MRSLDHLLRRSINSESTKYAYRWLFSRAQHLQQLSHSKSKSLFGIFRSLINQYHRHVPIEYLCGSAMFFNRLFIVNRHVLISRHDSESLIHHVQQQFLKLLRFNKRIGMLSKSLHYARQDLSSFGFVFLIFMIAYAIMGFGIFGRSLRSYKSFFTALATCFRMLLDEINAPDMIAVSRVYGKKR